MKEKILTKKEIDEYIQRHYKPDGFDFSKLLSGKKGLENITVVGAASTVSAPSLILDSLLAGIRNAIELTFSEKLMQLIKEKGRKPSDIYKKADISKELFSKIKGNKNYHPTKDTALAFSMALHLNLKETEDLISRAGYTFSSSIKRDLIVKCYIESKTYNIDDLNIKLSDYGLAPLTNKRSA